MELVDLTGKTAIVTGASRGIGAATARLFASRGAFVVLAARSRAAIDDVAGDIVRAGGSALAQSCDVSRYGDVERLVAAAGAATGQLDILINNAAVIDPIALLADSDPVAWGAVMDINIKGVYHAMRCAVPAMLARGGGTVINVSSGAAVSALEGWSHYCASKAAVLSLTRNTDLEYRERGLRVLGLSPGTVETDMQARIRASGMNRISQMDPADHIPPAWVAQALLWLCGPAADRWRGTDFSLKTREGRAAVGLPPPA